MAEKRYKYFVHGMHCKACVVLTESELGEHKLVSGAKAVLAERSVEIRGDFGNKSQEEVMGLFDGLLEKHGYKLSLEKEHTREWRQLYVAIPIAIAFIGLFLLLQKAGVVNIVNAANVNITTALVIGLVASVSTCMAVVGGLVLSISASYAMEGKKVIPQVYFHSGRMLAFFVFGGAIGMIGGVFRPGVWGTTALSVAVAIVMISLGINLLDLVPWTKKIQVTLPGSWGNGVRGIKNINQKIMPFVTGAATFFLPCGFTQSMQLYTLNAGGFLTGAFLMTAFALGTLPVLALLSFGSLSINNKFKSGIFFKASGLVVIFFGIINLLNALAAAGVIEPLNLF